MTKDEALKLALEALENHCGNYKLDDAGCERWNKAVDAIKEALALTSTQCEVQPEQSSSQEPVGEFKQSLHVNYPTLVWNNGYVAKFGDKLYTTPPKRQPLTDDEINKCDMCGYVGKDKDSIGQCPKCRWDELRPLVEKARQKPLTDDQIYDMYNEPRSDAEMLEFARAIEAALGIKE